ncbi:MAG: D-alanine--D-alanine ligase family protein [Chloroflexota bacterium]
MSKLRVGVMYGSRSVEHEVSIITALQAMDAMDSARYEPVPIYITKDGDWLTGPALRKLETYKSGPAAARGVVRASLPPTPNQGILSVAEQRGGFWPLTGARAGGQPTAIDVAFPCVHGTFGEDGTLQGLCELADLPYVGSGVLASAVGMDKILMKAVFRAAGLPVIDGLPLGRDEWERDPDSTIDRIEQDVGYPAFVKPANLGSSVGISRATDRDGLRAALDVASHYDTRLVVERGIDGALDINCAVLGQGSDLRVSVCEQPVSWEAFLSYEDKYIRGGKAQGMKGASRRIPAPISPGLTSQIQDLAKRAFQAIDAAGVARIDVLLAPNEQVFVNEINTLPGSLSFYLWEATDLPFPKLVDRLIELAVARHAAHQKTTYSFDSALLAKTLESGGKGRRP